MVVMEMKMLFVVLKVVGVRGVEGVDGVGRDGRRIMRNNRRGGSRSW